MFELTNIEWVGLVIGALLIGISKTGLPGVGILAIPIFANILPAKASTGVVLPMLILADIFAVIWYRRHAVWSHLFRVFPWTVLGVLIGYALMGRINDRQLSPVIGVIVLAMLALNAWRNRRRDAELQIPTHLSFAALIGVMAGATTMLANAAGPIMAIYLLAMRLPKTTFVGTAAWYFFIINVFKVPFSAHLGLITPGTMHFNLVLAPAIMAGALLGFWLVRWIPEKPFNIAILIFAILGAVRLLL